jgi:hypothetical protein
MKHGNRNIKKIEYLTDYLTFLNERYSLLFNVLERSTGAFFAHLKLDFEWLIQSMNGAVSVIAEVSALDKENECGIQKL